MKHTKSKWVSKRLKYVDEVSYWSNIFKIFRCNGTAKTHVQSRVSSSSSSSTTSLWPSSSSSTISSSWAWTANRRKDRNNTTTLRILDICRQIENRGIKYVRRLWPSLWRVSRDNIGLLLAIKKNWNSDILRARSANSLKHPPVCKRYSYMSRAVCTYKMYLYVCISYLKKIFFCAWRRQPAVVRYDIICVCLLWDKSHIGVHDGFHMFLSTKG